VEYRIVFYATEAGEKPMLAFLESLRGRNDVLHKLVTAGLLKLKHRDNHGPPLTAAVHSATSLYELRVGRTDIARVFFFFRPGQEVVCTHGYVKKAQKLDPAEIARAERYKADWEQRHPVISRR
jgi:phage-related protein